MTLVLLLDPTDHLDDPTFFPDVQFEVAFADDATVVEPAWDDVSRYGLEFVTRRGREMEGDQSEPGSLMATLDNQTRQFDPTNTAGDFWPDVVPLRQVRLRVAMPGEDVTTYDGGYGSGAYGAGGYSESGFGVGTSTYDVFRGDVFDWPQDWDGRSNHVPLEAGDAFDAFSSATFTLSRPAELSGARVAAILDTIGWPAALTDIDAGKSMIAAIDYQAANALQSLQDVASSESGVVFVAPTGVLRFHDRHRRLFDTTVKGTFSNDPVDDELPFVDAKPTYRRERIYNQATVIAYNGEARSAEDAASRERYRLRSRPALQTVLHDPNEAQSRANAIVATHKDPVLRVEELTLEPQMDMALWAQALGREISDRIRVKAWPPGSPLSVIDSTVTIESVEQRYSREAHRWQTVFKCSPAAIDDDFWHLGVSHLGVGSRVGD